MKKCTLKLLIVGRLIEQWGLGMYFQLKSQIREEAIVSLNGSQSLNNPSVREIGNSWYGGCEQGSCFDAFAE